MTPQSTPPGPVIAALAAFVVLACRGPAQQDAQNGAVVAAADTLELVGPGTISTSANEFGVSVTADGAEIYFGRAVADGRMPVLRAIRAGERWEAPAEVPLLEDGVAIDPFVTADGTRLYFSSNAPLHPGDTTGDMNTWVAERTGNAWGAPRPLPEPLNSAGDEVFASLAADGTLYFGRSTPGEPRHFYRAAPREAGFAAPVRLEIDTGSARVGNPAVAPDGSFLVFWATTGEDGGGPPDLMIRCRTGAGWGAPWNPGPPVNSGQAEIAPHVSADGHWLYFTSERPGLAAPPPAGERPPGDIYRYPVSALRPGC
ncbi:MAG: hypothetical protein WEB88_17165 [Gemmatimonadota bacterium]